MIKLENILKKYADTDTLALNNLSLQVDDGEFVYIIGPTGAGKSTLIKLLYKGITPDEGTVTINGTDVSTIKEKEIPYFRRKLGIIFQDYKLLPKKTVFENIAFALEAVGTPRKTIKKKVFEALAIVGLVDKAESFPNQLSGGQQQRVVIARAIINNPSIIIADEPTGNLDSDTSSEIVELLNEINKNGTTIVMITHDETIVDRYPRKTYEIKEGQIRTVERGDNH